MTEARNTESNYLYSFFKRPQSNRQNGKDPKVHNPTSAKCKKTVNSIRKTADQATDIIGSASYISTIYYRSLYNGGKGCKLDDITCSKEISINTGYIDTSFAILNVFAELLQKITHNFSQPHPVTKLIPIITKELRRIARHYAFLFHITLYIDSQIEHLTRHKKGETHNSDLTFTLEAVGTLLFATFIMSDRIKAYMRTSACCPAKRSTYGKVIDSISGFIEDFTFGISITDAALTLFLSEVTAVKPGALAVRYATGALTGIIRGIHKWINEFDPENKEQSHYEKIRNFIALPLSWIFFGLNIYESYYWSHSDSIIQLAINSGFFLTLFILNFYDELKEEQPNTHVENISEEQPLISAAAPAINTYGSETLSSPRLTA